MKTGSLITLSWEGLRPGQKSPENLSWRLQPIQAHYPAGYFDGASQLSRCGCGAWLMLSPNCHYKIFWHGGYGTDMRAEVLACWGLMWFASQLCVENLCVYGDSKVLIEHLNKGTALNHRNLRSRLDRISILRKAFSAIHYNHIYREKNCMADRLSKKGL